VVARDAVQQAEPVAEAVARVVEEDN